MCSQQTTKITIRCQERKNKNKLIDWSVIFYLFYTRERRRASKKAKQVHTTMSKREMIQEFHLRNLLFVKPIFTIWQQGTGPQFFNTLIIQWWLNLLKEAQVLKNLKITFSNIANPTCFENQYSKTNVVFINYWYQSSLPLFICTRCALASTVNCKP